MPIRPVPHGPAPHRPVAFTAFAVVAVAAVLVALGVPAATAGAATCLLPPVDAPVTDPFRAPACTYCPGNRGIEYGPDPGTTVVAAAAGEVTFAGTVAGVRWVTVRQDDGLLASYGRLDGIRVSAHQRIAAGDWLATTTERFYFGLRDGDVPVDPTPLLGVRRYPTRLVPTDGSGRRPAGPGRLVCAATEVRHVPAVGRAR